MNGLDTAPDVLLTPLFGKTHLLLALAVAGALLGCGVLAAIRATFTRYVLLALEICIAKRHAARVALGVMARLQVVVDSYAFIEDKTLAFPQ